MFPRFGFVSEASPALCMGSLFAVANMSVFYLAVVIWPGLKDGSPIDTGPGWTPVVVMMRISGARW